jgi:hypothetical protein
VVRRRPKKNSMDFYLVIGITTRIVSSSDNAISFCEDVCSVMYETDIARLYKLQ